MEGDWLYREIGNNIKRCRQGRLTQERLASEIGISRASLANIEAGRQKILIHNLYAIARALDIDTLSSLMPDMLQTETTSPTALPLPAQGLNEKQKREILQLMERVPNNHHDSKQGDSS